LDLVGRLETAGTYKNVREEMVCDI